jgi:hypothetical protein
VAALGNPHDDGSPQTEKDWKSLNADRKTDAYSFAKGHAEKLVADFVEDLPAEEFFDAVALLPSVIIGQQLQPETVGTSVGIVLRMVNGKYRLLGVPRFSFGWVNVHDVATVHAYAMTLSIGEKKFDRFILSAEVLDLPTVCGIMRTIYRDNPAIFNNIPAHIVPNLLVYAAAIIPGFENLLTYSEVKRRFKSRVAINGRKIVNTLKAQGVQFEYTPIKDGLRDTVNSLVELGLVGQPQQDKGKGLLYLTVGAVAVGIAAYVMYKY